MKENTAIPHDPLLCNFQLPLQGTYHPRGFSVEIHTNSQEVLLAADESWGTRRRLFIEKPVRAAICVSEDGPDGTLLQPVCRSRENLVTQVGDSQNFYSVDLRSGSALAWVTKTTVNNRAGFRYHYLESLALVTLMSRYMTPVHAACVSLNGQGVLLCGDSGAGKSSLAFACARRGWTYTTDDASSLVRNRSERIVVGEPQQIRFRESAVDLFPELRYERLTRRINGELAIELSTSKLAHIKTADQASVEHIVFLDRRDDAATNLQQLSVDAVQPWFEKVICYGEQETRNSQRVSLGNLLTANIVELTYSDLDTAVSSLESLVTDNL
ncbi:MAG TPA: aldolase [Terriglobales bacterium]|jgi:hypothetical protein